MQLRHVGGHAVKLVMPYHVEGMCYNFGLLKDCALLNRIPTLQCHRAPKLQE